MRVEFFSCYAVAFNEFGDCAKIEGEMFYRLIRTFALRKSPGIRKSDTTICREIVESWPREYLKWVSISEANK